MKASGSLLLTAFADVAGRQIGDVVKLVDEHLQNRSEDDQSIQYLWVSILAAS